MNPGQRRGSHEQGDGRDGALEGEVGGTLKALLGLVTLAANLPDVAAASVADPALATSHEAQQQRGEGSGGQGVAEGERELVVFRRLILLALLHLAALATPLLALALYDTQQAATHTREEQARTLSAATPSGTALMGGVESAADLDASSRGSGPQHSGVGESNGGASAAHAPVAGRQASPCPFSLPLSALRLLGVPPL